MVFVVWYGKLIQESNGKSVTSISNNKIQTRLWNPDLPRHLNYWSKTLVREKDIFHPDDFLLGKPGIVPGQASAFERLIRILWTAIGCESGIFLTCIYTLKAEKKCPRDPWKTFKTKIKTCQTTNSHDFLVLKVVRWTCWQSCFVVYEMSQEYVVIAPSSAFVSLP